jgi:hypothetical protein
MRGGLIRVHLFVIPQVNPPSKLNICTVLYWLSLCSVVLCMPPPHPLPTYDPLSFPPYTVYVYKVYLFTHFHTGNSKSANFIGVPVCRLQFSIVLRIIRKSHIRKFLGFSCRLIENPQIAKKFGPANRTSTNCHIRVRSHAPSIQSHRGTKVV